MNRRPVTCATGIDLERAQADGRISVNDADQVRAFAAFCAAAPPRPKPGQGYTTAELRQLRQAIVDHMPDDEMVTVIERALERREGQA